MHRIHINTSSEKSLLLTGVTLEQLPALLPEGKTFIITDTNVMALYGAQFPEAGVFEIFPGEGSKTMRVVEDICGWLLESGADRSSFILGIGGGVVCDVAGLVASVYMRGLKHAFVSSTLLSQVDASIGGKTGVNHGRYKNVIGTFKQPEFVLCDHSMLMTLPEEEFMSGFGELIKHAVIRDREMFDDIRRSFDAIISRDPAVLGDMIYRAVAIKATIVNSDPLEMGERRVLNFGHTFGHILETTYHIPHGVAVMEGMLIAGELSVWTGVMAQPELILLQEMLNKAGINSVHHLPDDVLHMVLRDKKSVSGKLNMVILKAIGQAVIQVLGENELSDFIKYYREKVNRTK